MRLRAMFALAALAVACKGPAVRPTKEHRPLPAELARCGPAGAHGQLTAEMLVDADGAVPAAFIRDGKGLQPSQVDRCVAESLVTARLPSAGLQALQPLGPIVFQKAGVTLPDKSETPAEPLDEKRAQDSLTFAEWATATDRGWGAFYVQRFDEAARQFRAALVKGQPAADHLRALVGLASALAAAAGGAGFAGDGRSPQGGALIDGKEAREAAAKALQLKPESEATHEALLRVCLAAKDDACARDEWEKASKAPDAKVRVRELGQLREAAAAAAERLASQDKNRREQALAKERRDREAEQRKLDPHGCGKLAGGERLLCYVKGCFGKGAQEYSDGLRELTGHAYKAGSWTIAEGMNGASNVTLSIRAREGQPHDASWEVKPAEGEGNKPELKPLDIDANNIALQFDACR